MRLAFLALALFALAAAPARATDCAWMVMPNIRPPDQQLNQDSGSSYPSFWSWQYILVADHFQIYGDMNSAAYRCTTNLGVAAGGHGTFVIGRIAACIAPAEDIEGVACNEFKARAELDDDSYAQAFGSQRIKASKMDLDCHACGGVEATAAGHGDGDSGTIKVQLYQGGPNIDIHWSKGGAVESVFQASDGGTGGRSPEVITCQTNLNLSLSVGWWNDTGGAKIKDSRSQLTVWGTCDGYCGVVIPVIESSVGY